MNSLSDLELKDRLAHELQKDFESLEDLQLLLDAGELSEQELLEAYAKLSTLEIADEDDYTGLEKYERVNVEYLDELGVLPLSMDENKIVLAFSNPFDLEKQCRHWQLLFELPIEVFLMRRSFILRKVNEIYHQNQDLAFDESSEESLKDLAKEAPIVRLVNDVFSRAVELGVSDIHVEPGDADLNIRYRIDGILHTHFTPPPQQFAAIASRLKLIGGLNIAESRIPQDGRIELSINGKAIDVRMNTLPGMYGESIVMRLLQKNLQSFSLGNVGMELDLQEKFKKLIDKPHGLILVVGPTGSGKTTTLYCALTLLNSGNEKIITIEDPIEYQVNGITQVQVKSSIGLSFANGLRSIVRQDPDIILVGEIRDKETAEISINAALTGHLVLSTLHTNDAAGAVSRLQDMGVENFLIASSLMGILSQRLVRRICTVCKGVDSSSCRTCGGTGYKGRVGIYELLEVNKEIQEAIIARKDSGKIGELAVNHGMQRITENALQKVEQGITTREEVLRVCSSGEL